MIITETLAKGLKNRFFSEMDEEVVKKLNQLIKDGYKLEYDTMEVANNGHHRIWIPYSGEVDEHYTCYRMIPKEEE